MHSRRRTTALVVCLLPLVLARCVPVAGTTDEILMRQRAQAGLLAVHLGPPPQAVPQACDDQCPRSLSGEYIVRADSCYDWGDALPHGYLVSKLPDFSLIPAGPARLIITADSSAAVNPGYRLQSVMAGAPAKRLGSIPGGRGADTFDCGGCLVSRDFRSAGNFGGASGFFWSLGRDRSGALVYSIAYESREFFHHQRRQMRCVFPLA